MRKIISATIALFASLLYVGGCASKPPVIQPPARYQPQGMVPAFTSEDWRLVLNKVVTPGGYVRWDLFQTDGELREAMNRYISLIGNVSPENRPDLFQTRADQLAYWINAYNATCVYGVLLRNVTNPPALYNTDRFSFGGHAYTLDQVEAQKIKALNDPRAVFGINRCTRSSPPMRKEPYAGLTLSAQLVDQGKLFLSDSRGVVRVDDVAKVSDLLAINYAADFQAAYQKKFGRPGTLLQTIQPYAAKHSLLSGATMAVPMGYDGALNRP